SKIPLPHQRFLLHVAPHAVCHYGPALRQWAVPPRSHHGVHPGGHLGALPAHAGACGAFRLRRRHARRGDYAQGGSRRRESRATDRQRQRVASARLPAFPREFRQLVHDAQHGKCRAVARHLPKPQSGGPDLRLADPKVVAFLREWTSVTPLQPEVKNKIAEWVGGKEAGGKLADWDISRDAPYFGIEIPDAPGKYFYVWLDAPIGYLASLKNYFDTGKARANGEARSFDEFIA